MIIGSSMHSVFIRIVTGGDHLSFVFSVRPDPHFLVGDFHIADLDEADGIVFVGVTALKVNRL